MPIGSGIIRKITNSEISLQRSDLGGVSSCLQGLSEAEVGPLQAIVEFNRLLSAKVQPLPYPMS